MKKIIFGLFALLAISAVNAEAASGVRGAKGSFALNYTTTVSTVIARSPAAVYAVVLSTGAAGEFVALWDAATVTGGQNAQTLTNLKTRCQFSASSNTFCNYDPPLQFINGVIVAESAAAGQALVIYEPGRVTQGY